MKEKVEEQEALAEAYGEMGDATTSVDDEINKALADSKGVAVDDSLAQLKAYERGEEVGSAAMSRLSRRRFLGLLAAGWGDGMGRVPPRASAPADCPRPHCQCRAASRPHDARDHGVVRFRPRTTAL